MDRAQLSIAAFEASEIDPNTFTHEAHIYLAWLYLREFEASEALARFDAGLRRLVDKLGASSKYSAMITWLFFKLIDARMRERESWGDFRARNVDLIDERPGPRV